MNKNGIWNELKLKELRIHELRDLARKFGVKSPTSQNKDELIAQILQIINGETTPYVSSSGKGRPSRAASQLNNLVDYFLPEDINKDLSNSDEFLENAKFDFFAAMPDAEFESFSSKNKISEVEGYLDVTTSGYGIIRVNGFNVSTEDVYVHKIFIVKNGLQAGDYVKATAQEIYKNRPRAITSILSVNNNIPRPEFKFDDLNRVETQKTFMFDNNLFLLGSTSVVLKQEKIMFNETVNVCNSIKNFNGKVIIISPTKNEDRFEAKGGVIKVPYQITKNYFNTFSNFKLALIKAKEFAISENVLMVISGINYFYRAMLAIMSESEQNNIKLEEMVKHEITKYLLSAKCLEQSSLSIVLYNTVNLEPKIFDFVKYDIGGLADYVIIK